MWHAGTMLHADAERDTMMDVGWWCTRGEDQMGKEYRYIRLIRWGQFVAPVFSGLVMAACWWMFACGILSEDAHPPFWRGFIVAVMAVLLTESAVGCWLYYRLAGVRVRLDAEELVYTNRRGERRIPYEHIRSIGCRLLRGGWGGGWLRIESDQPEDKIRLTLALAHAWEFCVGLKEAIDQRGLSERYDRAKFSRFARTAGANDSCLARLRERAWNLALLVVAASAVASLLALDSGMGTMGTTGAGMVATGIVLMVVGIAETIVFKRDLRRGEEDSFDRPARDVGFEKTVYRRALVIGMIPYLLVFGFVRGLGR